MSSRHLPGGGGNRRPWSAHVDLYRKIPTDLMEGTNRGSIMSYLSLLVMVILFLWETSAFFQTKTVTDLALDYKRDPGDVNADNGNNKKKTKNADIEFGGLLARNPNAYADHIRLNFNITMTDLSCDFAVIDVVSVLGTDQNVTAHITKWNIDGDGIRKGYKGRNRNQKDITLFDPNIEETLEGLHEDGEDAISVDPKTLEEYKKNYDYVFVDFYATWCSHCKDLAPTWEAMAEVMTAASMNVVDTEHNLDEFPHKFNDADYDHAVKVALPVVVAKVDCVDHLSLCQKENIRMYPTLRLFIDGKPWQGGSDYKGHRTVMEMVDWLKHMEEQHKSAMNSDGEKGNTMRKLHTAHESAKEYMGIDSDASSKADDVTNKRNTKKRLYNEWRDAEHPGCQLSGHLLLDRVPGNFHILARSKHHDLSPHMTNVSHIVNALSIGHPGISRLVANIPDNVQAKLSPMNGNVYTTTNLHESHHHYLKVITTISSDANLYQIIPNSQLSLYRSDMVPEAKFVYDLSPISVKYRKESRPWYEYFTSLFAIIGGVFTIVGMIESSIHATVKAGNTRRRQSNSGGGGRGRY